MIPLFAGLLGVWILICLVFFREYRQIRRAWRAVPLRIGVTGTRGKTGLVRMVAAGLEACGLTVLAKTSGSQAKILYPGGSESFLPRFSPSTILEQKKVLAAAEKTPAAPDGQGGGPVLVCEIMSIRPDYQKVESQKLLNLTHCIITNARIDHPQQGDTKAEVLASLAGSVTPGCVVFCPREESGPALAEAAARQGARLVLTSPPEGSAGWNRENRALALAVCRELGLHQGRFLEGLESAVMDIGAAGIWRLDGLDCVNLFAANDIESTGVLVDGLPPGRRAGLLNLRADRQERTLQYIRAARQGAFDDFEIFFASGRQAELFKRRAGKFLDVRVLPETGPEKQMEFIAGVLDGGPWQLIGMGNISGAEALLDFWKARGLPVA